MTDKYQGLREAISNAEHFTGTYWLDRYRGESRPETIRDLLAERDALQAECERLRNDSERYRWLRESQVCEVGAGAGKEATIVFWRDEPFEPETAEQLDALIDAARGGE